MNHGPWIQGSPLCIECEGHIYYNNERVCTCLWVCVYLLCVSPHLFNPSNERLILIRPQVNKITCRNIMCLILKLPKENTATAIRRIFAYPSKISVIQCHCIPKDTHQLITYQVENSHCQCSTVQSTCGLVQD